MRKIFLALFAACVMFVSKTNAQLTITMSSVEVDKNAQASVDVTVNGFTNLLGVQYSINFDSTVLTYENATNFSAALPGLNASGVSGPNGIGVKNGQITFSWFDQQGTGKSLPGGTRLFTIVFKATGQSCASSDIVTSNVPRIIEIIRNDFMDVPLVNVKGQVKIKCDPNADPCPNPACSNPNSLTISGPQVESEQNKDICIPVTVKNFKILQSGQGSIKWDKTLLEFKEVKTPATGGIPGFSGGFNTSDAANGEFKYLWANDNPAVPLTLPENTVIMELCFKVIGDAGKTACILFGQGSLPTEWANDNGEVPVCYNYSKIKITGSTNTDPCPNPSCTNPNSLVMSGTIVNSERNKEVCIPISVKNFKLMQSGQGSIKWDTTLIKFTQVKTPATGGIPGFSGGFNTADAARGEFKYLWANDNPAVPLTLPENTIIMELCFNVVGAIGKTGCVLLGQGGLSTEWADDNGEVPVCYNYGKIKIIDPNQPNTVIIRAGNGTGSLNDNICIDVTVDNFTNILGASATFTWNPAHLEFVKTDMYSLDGLNSTAFSNTASELKFLWFSPEPKSKATGEKIFQICFKIKQCVASTPVTVSNLEIIGNGNPPVTLPSQAISGSVSCTTPPPACSATCTLGTITQVTCNGGTDGAVALTVTGTNLGSHMIVWKNAAGTVVKASAPVTSGTNLTGVAAGTYTYEVSFNGTICCSGTATVTQPAVISIPTANVVTNVTCNAKGAINITATSGGTPPYTYAWNPNLGNLANPTNLDMGAYSVTVTDSRNCTRTASFTVGSSITALNVTASGVNVKCKGDTSGSISLNVSGGCTPYSFAWSGGATGQNPQGLAAGTYSVTVTDNNGQTKTAAVTITEPNALNINVTQITGSSTPAGNGSITIAVTGGTTPYTIKWTGPTTIADGTLNGTSLKAGTYNVTVTDANGCTAVRSAMEVPSLAVAPKVASAGVSTSFSGFGVSCFGSRNGVITGKLSEGTYPVTGVLKSGNNTVGNPIGIISPDFSFSNLGAGSYTIELTNVAGGPIVVGPIVVTQPTKLESAEPVITCTERNKSTGSIELNLNSSGAGGYTYNWQGLQDTGRIVTELAKGFYNVTVTDANDCELRITNLEVKECPKEGECFEASTVITPNGDNFNDAFIINCIDTLETNLSVFDRWGRLVYAQSDYDNSWQGIDNDGDDLPEGGYIWVLEVNFGQGRREVYKGVVTLLREN
jgi:gliding motility-associated-like protein